MSRRPEAPHTPPAAFICYVSRCNALMRQHSIRANTPGVADSLCESVKPANLVQVPPLAARSKTSQGSCGSGRALRLRRVQGAVGRHAISRRSDAALRRHATLDRGCSGGAAGHGGPQRVIRDRRPRRARSRDGATDDLDGRRRLRRSDDIRRLAHKCWLAVGGARAIAAAGRLAARGIVQLVVAAAAAAGPQEGRQLQLRSGSGDGRPLRCGNARLDIVQSLPSAHGSASSTSRRHDGPRRSAEEQQSSPRGRAQVDDLARGAEARKGGLGRRLRDREHGRPTVPMATSTQAPVRRNTARIVRQRWLAGCLDDAQTINKGACLLVRQNTDMMQMNAAGGAARSYDLAASRSGSWTLRLPCTTACRGGPADRGYLTGEAMQHWGL